VHGRRRWTEQEIECAVLLAWYFHAARLCEFDVVCKLIVPYNGYEARGADVFWILESNLKLKTEIGKWLNPPFSELKPVTLSALFAEEEVKHLEPFVSLTSDHLVFLLSLISWKCSSATFTPRTETFFKELDAAVQCLKKRAQMLSSLRHPPNTFSRDFLFAELFSADQYDDDGTLIPLLFDAQEEKDEPKPQVKHTRVDISSTRRFVEQASMKFVSVVNLYVTYLERMQIETAEIGPLVYVEVEEKVELDLKISKFRSNMLREYKTADERMTREEFLDWWATRQVSESDINVYLAMYPYENPNRVSARRTLGQRPSVPFFIDKDWTIAKALNNRNQVRLATDFCLSLLTREKNGYDVEQALVLSRWYDKPIRTHQPVVARLQLLDVWIVVLDGDWSKPYAFTSFTAVFIWLRSKGLLQDEYDKVVTHDRDIELTKNVGKWDKLWSHRR
jgi:hypothetical protein